MKNSLKKQHLKIFDGFEEVEEMIEKQNKQYVVFQNNVYDIEQFKSKHPGGEDILEDYIGYDIEEAFVSNNIHSHSKMAHSDLAGLQVGTIKYADENDDKGDNNNTNSIQNQQEYQQKNNQSQQTEKRNINDYDIGDEQKDGLQFQNNSKYPVLIGNNKIEYGQFQIYLNIPILSQVGQITPQSYRTMLTQPWTSANNSYAFTGNDVTDKVLGNKWNFLKYHILIVLLLLVYQYRKKVDYTILSTLVYLIFGTILLSFIDYMTQRFVVNPDKIIQNSLMRQVHYALFGQHYFFPNKPNLTGYSPIWLFVVYGLIFMINKVLFQNPLIAIILLGGHIYMICQELFHFQYHQQNINNNFLQIRKHLHLIQHEKKHNQNFGILFPIWDQIFQTYNSNQ